MSKYLFRRLALIALGLIVIAGLFMVDSSAQRRRRRRSRPAAPRITNPAIYQPSANDNANNTADTGTGTGDTNPNQNTQPTPAASDPESMRRTIRDLSTQVDKLNNKLSQMEESQRSLVDLERLSRAEQRTTSLRAELGEVQTKEADLEARAEDIEYALKPENIERSVAGYGTTHPEELREQRRRQLESEKARVRKQLDQLAASHAHLDQAIAAADIEVERLRKRLDVGDQADLENAKTKSQASEGTSQPGATPRPSPSPYRPQ